MASSTRNTARRQGVQALAIGKGLATKPAPRMAGFTPRMAAELTPILLDRASGEMCLMLDVQKADLTQQQGCPAAVKLVRTLYKESDPFPWTNRTFDLYLVESLEDIGLWTKGIGIRDARLHRTQIVLEVDGSAFVQERVWLRGEKIVYLDGEPWQRFMRRRFPLIP